MTSYVDTTFDHQLIACPRKEYRGISFERCRFVECSLQSRNGPEKRVAIRDSVFKDCITEGYCNLRGAIVEDVMIENLRTEELMLLWGCAFRRVRLIGQFGDINVNEVLTSGAFLYPREKRVSDQFVADNMEFYKTVDWALDIREADFVSLSLRGVPGELVLRDPERHFLVRRESLLSERWKEIGFGDATEISVELNELVRSDRTAEVFIVPELDPQRRYDVRAVLELLRDAGIAE